MRGKYVMTEWKHAWKHPWMRVGILASVILLVCAVAFAWQGERYIEAAGIGLAPNGMSGAQAKAMARRAAVVDLQRNFVKILGEGSPDGFIRGVEILEGTWDGTSYRVSGRVRLPAF